MRCQEIRLLMKSYFSDETDEYTKIKIHHHLAKCTACSEQYDMWSRGEAAILSNNLPLPRHDVPRSSGQLSSSVMDRIKNEEKWANPNLSSAGASGRNSKKVILLASLTLIVVFFIILSTTFFPQHEVYTDIISAYSTNDAEQVNKIILSQASADASGTVEIKPEINFQVFENLNEPIIFSLPDEGEKSSAPLMLLLGIFGFFCIILGLSWLARV